MTSRQGSVNRESPIAEMETRVRRAFVFSLLMKWFFVLGARGQARYCVCSLGVSVVIRTVIGVDLCVGRLVHTLS